MRPPACGGDGGGAGSALAAAPSAAKARCSSGGSGEMALPSDPSVCAEPSEADGPLEE